MPPIREVTAFPGLSMILRVETEVRVASGPDRHQTRSFVTSLAPEVVSPQRLLALIHGHWSIENRLHFIKDRWRDEDRQWSTRPGLAERLAMRRDAALTALWRLPGVPADRPIRARADSPGTQTPQSPPVHRGFG